MHGSSEERSSISVPEQLPRVELRAEGASRRRSRHLGVGETESVLARGRWGPISEEYRANTLHGKEATAPASKSQFRFSATMGWLELLDTGGRPSIFHPIARGDKRCDCSVNGRPHRLRRERKWEFLMPKVVTSARVSYAADEQDNLSPASAGLFLCLRKRTQCGHNKIRG